MSSVVRFKFLPLDATGKPTGFFSKRARIGEETLSLGDEEISLRDIWQAERQPGVLVLRMMDSQRSIAVKFTGGNAMKVLRTINLRASATRAKWHEQELARLGTRNLFSVFVCPYCGFTNELSGYPQTPQVYCEYCGRVLTISDKPMRYEGRYGMCRSCRMYGRVKEYTSFLLVFLVLIHYFRWQKRRDCTMCMRDGVWSNLVANIPFLVGLPLALWQTIRAYWPTFGPLAGLDRANRLARTKKFDLAIHRYELIEHQVRYSAAVLYNHASMLSASGREAEVVEKLEQALAHCGNFLPAYTLLVATYESLGMTDRLRDLQQTWHRASMLVAGRYSETELAAMTDM